MKKVICIVLTLVVFMMSLPLTVLAAEGDILLSEAVIVVSDDASITDNYAAERLKFYLDKIMGGDIAVVSDNTANDCVEISVGDTEREDLDFAGKKDGSYVITSEKDLIVINGAGNKGTINGVYAFLEKYCDCHWYEDEVIVIPENASLSVEKGINVTYTPFFEYSETDTKSSRDPEFSVANGYGRIIGAPDVHSGNSCKIKINSL